MSENGDPPISTIKVLQGFTKFTGMWTGAKGRLPGTEVPQATSIDILQGPCSHLGVDDDFIGRSILIRLHFDEATLPNLYLPALFWQHPNHSDNGDPHSWERAWSADKEGDESNTMMCRLDDQDPEERTLLVIFRGILPPRTSNVAGLYKLRLVLVLGERENAGYPGLAQIFTRGIRPLRDRPEDTVEISRGGRERRRPKRPKVEDDQTFPEFRQFGPYPF
ncbi:hypothetical protein B0T20DRAFT_121688 [Sordaria brevicollis]|uniref:Uncharacterized protein n=1 Tax=Sordaria brevicollis TaxID=83679 RepID=A0AAE0PKV3_SORBR|nr:hypothetical protein B0T20DRAFT_121688 [Sordaria brevicollis]